MQEKSKTTPCTGKKNYAFNNAPRCLAKTRRGTSCQSPAVRTKKRCRLHGCGKGSGAPIGNIYAVTHGQTTAEMKVFKHEVRQLLRKSRELVHEFS
ncbi:MAG: HGGxSTG domain-containing protein [Legionella sp.]|uniref:HGGxSTG domain-containing protein n=1 Tax=Legionella sp. TaxID=459 RepID=UPI0039E5EE30